MTEPTDISDDMMPLLFGRVLDGRGGGRPIAWDAAREWEPESLHEVLWLHLDRSQEGMREWLVEELGLSYPTAELLTSDRNRPRAFREGNALVGTLRGINFNPGAEPEDMISMQFWSDGRRLITLRRLPLQTPREVLARIDQGSGPTDASSTLTELAKLMIARMSQSIIDTNEVLDQLEDADPDTEAEMMLRRISIIRRNCLALKRHMAPQHEALEQIARDAPAWFEEHDRREIAESIARLRRHLDDIDISKESALVLQDEIRARSLASSEHATYMLTIVAGIFLPLTFLTGLMGINVGGMPGMDDPRAFWVVVAICIILFVVLIVTFRRLRWL
ncbi:MAG: zinc transporter ZntB [Erythrobacter sp.]|jgi:zinc transporter